MPKDRFPIENVPTNITNAFARKQAKYLLDMELMRQQVQGTVAPGTLNPLESAETLDVEFLQHSIAGNAGATELAGLTDLPIVMGRCIYAGKRIYLFDEWEADANTGSEGTYLVRKAETSVEISGVPLVYTLTLSKLEGWEDNAALGGKLETQAKVITDSENGIKDKPTYVFRLLGVKADLAVNKYAYSLIEDDYGNKKYVVRKIEQLAENTSAEPKAMYRLYADDIEGLESATIDIGEETINTYPVKLIDKAKTMSNSIGSQFGLRDVKVGTVDCISTSDDDGIVVSPEAYCELQYDDYDSSTYLVRKVDKIFTTPTSTIHRLDIVEKIEDTLFEGTPVDFAKTVTSVEGVLGIKDVPVLQIQCFFKNKDLTAQAYDFATDPNKTSLMLRKASELYRSASGNSHLYQLDMLDITSLDTLFGGSVYVTARTVSSYEGALGIKDVEVLKVDCIHTTAIDPPEAYELSTADYEGVEYMARRVMQKYISRTGLPKVYEIEMIPSSVLDSFYNTGKVVTAARTVSSIEGAGLGVQDAENVSLLALYRNSKEPPAAMSVQTLGSGNYLIRKVEQSFESKDKNTNVYKIDCVNTKDLVDWEGGKTYIQSKQQSAFEALTGVRDCESTNFVWISTTTPFPYYAYDIVSPYMIKNVDLAYRGIDGANYVYKIDAINSSALISAFDGLAYETEVVKSSTTNPLSNIKDTPSRVTTVIYEDYNSIPALDAFSIFNTELILDVNTVREDKVYKIRSVDTTALETWQGGKQFIIKHELAAMETLTGVRNCEDITFAYIYPTCTWETYDIVGDYMIKAVSKTFDGAGNNVYTINAINSGALISAFGGQAYETEVVKSSVSPEMASLIDTPAKVTTVLRANATGLTAYTTSGSELILDVRTVREGKAYKIKSINTSSLKTVGRYTVIEAKYTTSETSHEPHGTVDIPIYTVRIIVAHNATPPASYTTLGADWYIRSVEKVFEGTDKDVYQLTVNKIVGDTV